MPEELDEECDFTLPDQDRIKMLADALNFQTTALGSPETATDLEELEAILKKHYRP